MRVLVMPRGHGRDEQGAVAIIVAICLVVLLGLAAFVVDFGLAYTNKRQLQTSADAAAIAAAASLADESVSCAGLADGAQPAVNDVVVPIKNYAQLVSEGEQAGLEIMGDNHTDATYVPGSMAYECRGGAILVTWQNENPTDVTLGGAFRAQGGDVPSEILSSRTATAALDVPPGVGTGLRPFPFCSRYVPLGLGGNPTQVIRVEGPRTGGRPDDDATLPAPPSPVPPVGCPKPGGNWYHANCPGVTNNGNKQLKDAIEGGCDSAVVQAVDGTPPADPPGTAAFTSALMLACDPPGPTVPDDCLNSDPGNFNPTLATSWKSVMNRRETISVPVFCGYPPCNPVAVTPGDDVAGGNNVKYPIYRIVSVEICGFHFGSAPARQRYDGLCADSNMPPGTVDANGKPLPYRATEGDNQTNYFLVVFRSEVVAPVFGASTCTIGDATCDGGLRRTVLVE